MLLQWQVPGDLTSRRFGVAAYKNEEVMDQLRELSSLHEKSTVIQKALFRIPEAEDGKKIEIEVNDLYERLLSSHIGDRAKAMFRNGRALGTALGRISRDKDHKGHYRLRNSNGKSYWTIICDGGASGRDAAPEGETDEAQKGH